jgi:hypothetical protein
MLYNGRYLTVKFFWQKKSRRWVEPPALRVVGITACPLVTDGYGFSSVALQEESIWLTIKGIMDSSPGSTDELTASTSSYRVEVCVMLLGFFVDCLNCICVMRPPYAFDSVMSCIFVYACAMPTIKHRSISGPHCISKSILL